MLTKLHNLTKNKNVTFSLVCLLVSGFFDGLGFSTAPQIWVYSGIPMYLAFTKTLTLFILGISFYMIASWFLFRNGIKNSLIVTLLWFGSTIVNVAFVGGNFTNLMLIDRVLSVSVILLIGLLYYRGVAN